MGAFVPFFISFIDVKLFIQKLEPGEKIQKLNQHLGDLSVFKSY